MVRAVFEVVHAYFEVVRANYEVMCAYFEVVRANYEVMYVYFEVVRANYEVMYAYYVNGSGYFVNSSANSESVLRLCVNVYAYFIDCCAIF